jgi:hypothetical protein
MVLEIDLMSEINQAERREETLQEPKEKIMNYFGEKIEIQISHDCLERKLTN